MLKMIKAIVEGLIIAICILGFALVVTAIGVVKGLMLAPGYIWRQIEIIWLWNLKIVGTCINKVWDKIEED